MEVKTNSELLTSKNVQEKSNHGSYYYKIGYGYVKNESNTELAPSGNSIIKEEPENNDARSNSNEDTELGEKIKNYPLVLIKEEIDIKDYIPEEEDIGITNNSCFTSGNDDIDQISSTQRNNIVHNDSIENVKCAMKMSRWNEETTLRFVCEYLSHECLWNCKSEIYKSKHARRAAYKILENSMQINGFGEKEIKSKIKNLRTTYAQELKKIKDSKISGNNNLYVPTIKWFHIMDEYLRNVNSEISENECNIPIREDTDEGNKSESEPDIETNADFHESIPTKKQKRSHLVHIIKELRGISDTINSSVEENEFDVFGKHVGLQLKCLPLLLALEAQEHIQLYLNRIRRHHIQNISQENNSSQ